jgi:hypothetical protein
MHAVLSSQAWIVGYWLVWRYQLLLSGSSIGYCMLCAMLSCACVRYRCL